MIKKGKGWTYSVVYSFGMAFLSAGEESSAFQNAPQDTSAESSFLQETESRYQKMEQDNQMMIQNDQRLMQEGYDPNEAFPPIPFKTHLPSDQTNQSVQR